MEFDGTVVHETPKALLIRVATLGSPVEQDLWFPLSQVEIYGRNEETGEISFEIPEWLAEEKEMI